ncbi:hypothetical protein SAMN05428962_4727 [Paenibacillus sp. BC26]|nr:hypothetical protein SAMN05428962_4727 [Paenibacillus sp. BC26]
MGSWVWPSFIQSIFKESFSKITELILLKTDDRFTLTFMIIVTVKR